MLSDANHNCDSVASLQGLAWMTALLVRGHPPTDPPITINTPYPSLTIGAAPHPALLGLEAMCNTEEQSECMHQLMQKLQLWVLWSLL
jgi:hypothetical protein